MVNQEEFEARARFFTEAMNDLQRQYRMVIVPAPNGRLMIYDADDYDKKLFTKDIRYFIENIHSLLNIK
jgi:hypothetical protein